MSRLVYILPIVLVQACAHSSSESRSSSDQAKPGKGEDRAKVVGAQDQPSEDEVPEWLRKSSRADDPLVLESRARAAEMHRQILQSFNDKAATINFADGINVSEAEFIGRAYFTMEFGACGVTENAKDGGAEWLIRPRVGVAGHPLDEFIRVDKLTGTARYGSGPATEGREVIEYKRRLLQQNVARFSDRGAVQGAGEQGVGPDDRSPSAPARRSTP